MHIGILGGGNISDTHARAAAAIPGVQVVACHGGNRERTAKLAAQHGAAAYDTLEGFLDHRPMDIVAIGSPSGLHARAGHRGGAPRAARARPRSRSTSPPSAPTR